MPEVVLVGGIAERKGQTLSLSYRPGMRIRDLLSELAKALPEAFEADGSPKPGFLVFIDGVDYRVLSPDDQVKPSSRIHVIQVYHGG
jgi:hypothetical protein